MNSFFRRKEKLGKAT
uniref:Uncharacterized protein n=1 Tax=Arundo donax TaxID=35708 RepID=A0A0A9B1A5_ARUDO